MNEFIKHVTLFAHQFINFVPIITTLFTAYFTYRIKVISKDKRQDDLFKLRYEFYQTFKRHVVDLVEFREKIYNQRGDENNEDLELIKIYRQRSNSLISQAKWLFSDNDDKFAKSIEKELKNKSKSFAKQYEEDYNKKSEHDNDLVGSIDSEINKGFDKYLTIK